MKTDDRDVALFERATDLKEQEEQDDGYVFAEPGTQLKPQPQPAQSPQPISLTPKQIAAVQRAIWAASITVTHRHPAKNKRKRRQKKKNS